MPKQLFCMPYKHHPEIYIWIMRPILAPQIVIDPQIFVSVRSWQARRSLFIRRSDQRAAPSPFALRFN